jgi:cytochrome b6-f complex iron-sulfur subunit
MGAPMSDELERLNSVLDDLAAEHDPALRPGLSPDEIRLARTAAFLKAADVDALAPRDAFVESLAARLDEQRAPREQAGSEARSRLSRRGVLGKAAAAVAGLAAAGAGGVAAYEKGKQTGYQEEARETFEAPMVPGDRGAWMDTGHTAQAIGPGKAVRFQVGAVQGFLVNPGAGGRVYALSAACTHMGCLLTWLGGAGTLLCPCHGAQYNANGTVLSGIARHPLPRLRVRLGEDGRYQVWSVAQRPQVTTLAPYDTG